MKRESKLNIFNWQRYSFISVHFEVLCDVVMVLFLSVEHFQVQVAMQSSHKSSSLYTILSHFTRFFSLCTISVAFNTYLLLLVRLRMIHSIGCLFIYQSNKTDSIVFHVIECSSSISPPPSHFYDDFNISRFCCESFHIKCWYEVVSGALWDAR